MTRFTARLGTKFRQLPATMRMPKVEATTKGSSKKALPQRNMINHDGHPKKPREPLS